MARFDTEDTNLSMALDTKLRISSLVFMDFESTGIPTYEFQPRATEICLIAVERDHFLSLDEDEQEIRVQNKLRQCFYPWKRISQNCTTLTGLSNENLQNQKPMNEDFVSLFVAFLKRLPEPICVIAHNGNKFDFPLLQAEIRSLGCELPKDLFCADSYCAFRSLLEDLPTQTNFLLSSLEAPELPALAAEIPIDVDDKQSLDNASGDDDWPDDEQLLQQKFTYESLGFTYNYEDISSDDDSVEIVTREVNDGKCDKSSDSIIAVLHRKIEGDQNNNGTDSEVILLDCDEPLCECSDCHQKKSKERVSGFAQINKSIPNFKPISKDGIGSDILDVNNKIHVRESVIVPVALAGTSTELSKSRVENGTVEHFKEVSTNNFTAIPNVINSNLLRDVEADILLGDDMDYVVNYVSTPEFQKMENDIEIEFSRSQSEKTPIKVARIMSPSQQISKFPPRDRGTNELLKKQKDDACERISKSSNVKKRLFPIVEQQKMIGTEKEIAAVDLPSTAAFVTPNISNDEESSTIICRSPPKKLCNGTHLLSDNHEMEIETSRTKIDAPKASFHVNGENATSVIEASISSTHITRPAQKSTQQRAKLRYGLEALHELLVGAKPTVSHTAEDDTVALMRVCRTKRKEFCEWVDSNAVHLNRVSPMWIKNSMHGSIRRP